MRPWSRYSTWTGRLGSTGCSRPLRGSTARFSHRRDGVETEKTHGLVVDYHGVSRDLDDALSTFDWPDVQDTMRKMEEDPAPVVEAAAVQAESHLMGRDLSDTWACVSVFAPDASTEGDFKADLFERFNADYSRFSRLMDRFLPDPRAPGLHGPAGTANGDNAPTPGPSSFARTPTWTGRRLVPR